MKRIITALLTIASMAVCLSGTASDIPDAAWLLTYAGKPAISSLNDKRMIPLLRSRLPATVIGRVVGALNGSSGGVAVDGGRFVAMSGCARDCRLHALLWIDTKGTGGFGAIQEAVEGRDLLTIGSNGFTPSDLPDTAKTSLASWLSEQSLEPDVVEFMGPSNRPRSIDPATFRLPSRGL